MIESIQFQNFKVLRDTTLPLGRCTILVGPNGSGKSTVLQALEAVREPQSVSYPSLVTVGIPQTEGQAVEVRFNWGDPHRGVAPFAQWTQDGNRKRGVHVSEGAAESRSQINHVIPGIRIFSFDARAVAGPAAVSDKAELGTDGSNLAAVLDRLRDEEPDRFDAVNSQLGQWLPEFDCILFERPHQGKKSIALRTREGHYGIPASDLSQGTLIALALLTLAYLPDPPPLIGLEEPDRGIHPRLLRHVKDALHRLSHPESCGEKREPIQVIATTHNPYFLDLFKPEEIVIANRLDQEVRFERLSEQSNIDEILGDAPLGEAWYTGILGGVPSKP